MALNCITDQDNVVSITMARDYYPKRLVSEIQPTIEIPLLLVNSNDATPV